MLDKRAIDVTGHIKTIGKHAVNVRLHPDVTGGLQPRGHRDLTGGIVITAARPLRVSPGWPRGVTHMG